MVSIGQWGFQSTVPPEKSPSPIENSIADATMPRWHVTYIVKKSVSFYHWVRATIICEMVLGQKQQKLLACLGNPV
jgi:hypothetical protein